MKKNWLRMLSVLLCLALCFGLFGCGGNGEEGEGGDAEVKDSVVIATPTDIKAVDPMGNWDVGAYYVYHTCYDRLLNYDYETGELLPELATEWSVSEDGMEYTFKLREDVYWHDGTQFTAKDVVYTCHRGIETQNGNYTGVDHAVAVDDFTVKYIMGEKSSTVYAGQWSPDGAIIQEGSGDTIGTTINGTGPYKVKEWIIGDHLTIEANPDYWGGEPEVKEIKFVTMPESNARLMALQAGDIDAAAIDATNIKAATADENLTVLSTQGTSLHYIGFNYNNEILSNELVRKAIAHAVNKQDLIDAELEGYGAVQNSLVPPMINGHDSTITGYEYDVEKAKALLKEAGYENGFEIELSYRIGTHDAAAQVVQAQLAEIGITATLKGMESAAFNEYANNNQTEMCLHYRGSTAPGYYLRIMHSDRLTDGRNILGINRPDLDEAVDKAMYAVGDDHINGVKKAQQIAHEDCIVIPLYTATSFTVCNKDLNGVMVLPTGGNDFSNLSWN